MAAFAVRFLLFSYCCDLSLKILSSPQVQQSKRKTPPPCFFLEVTGGALNNLRVSKLEQDKGTQGASHPFAIAGTVQALAQLAAFQLASSRKTPPQNTYFRRG